MSVRERTIATMAAIILVGRMRRFWYSESWFQTQKGKAIEEAATLYDLAGGDNDD